MEFSKIQPIIEELDKLRAEVDAVDARLAPLIAKRFEIVRKIGALKRANGIAAVDGVRETEILRSVIECGDEVAEVYRRIFDIAHRIQKR
ncbi:MAG: chorismate mutase [Christensenellaceae bacterium]|jgi:chorismate mutase|nr:chorismate mutase [Christensenellaceae bacterium]